MEPFGYELPLRVIEAHEGSCVRRVTVNVGRGPRTTRNAPVAGTVTVADASFLAEIVKLITPSDPEGIMAVQLPNERLPFARDNGTVVGAPPLIE